MIDKCGTIPALMIGADTGLAPNALRAYERIAWAAGNAQNLYYPKAKKLSSFALMPYIERAAQFIIRAKGLNPEQVIFAGKHL